MNSRKLFLVIAVLALAATFAVTSSFAAPDHQATVAKKKKKLSYCQKKIKKVKGKHTQKVKSAKFFLAVTKRPSAYFYCSESPKFNGSITAWAGIKKTSKPLAVKKDCAIFYSETKATTYYGPGEMSLNIIDARYQKKGAVGQTFASTLGRTDDTFSFVSLSLSKNCVFAAGYVKNGQPTLQVAGMGSFPYQGFVETKIPGASVSELKNIKISVTSKTSVQVDWTQGGVPKTMDYPGDRE